METVNDIIKEMRDVLDRYGVKVFGEILFARGELCDRLDAAYRREMIDKYSGVVNEREKEIERLRKDLREIGDRLVYFFRNIDGTFSPPCVTEIYEIARYGNKDKENKDGDC